MKLQTWTDLLHAVMCVTMLALGTAGIITLASLNQLLAQMTRTLNLANTTGERIVYQLTQTPLWPPANQQPTE